MNSNTTSTSGEIHVRGNVLGSALVSGNGNTVTIVYGTDVLRRRDGPLENPYQGLDAFDETTSRFFFGREATTAALTGQIENISAPRGRLALRLLAIVGPSGSGKSSIARAGLIPALANTSAWWLRNPRIAVFRPLHSPLDSLADAIARLATGQQNPSAERAQYAAILRDHAKRGSSTGLAEVAHRYLGGSTAIILVVDQLEEVYSLSVSDGSNRERLESQLAAERRSFVATLLHAAASEDERLVLVTTLRSDFLGAVGRHDPDLSVAIACSHEIVPALSRENLRRAISEPARVAGRPIDAATIELILTQCEGQGAILPLVQFALQQVWDRANDGPDAAIALSAIGGLGGAIARTADDVLSSVQLKHQDHIVRVFLATVTPSDFSNRHTKRRAWLDEVTPVNTDGATVREAVEPFIKSRLLATGADDNGRIWFELPHEALIQHWGKLRDWLGTQGEDLRFSLRLQDAAHAWAESRGGLWRHPDLALMRRFVAKRFSQVNRTQLAFFRASERQAAFEKSLKWAAGVATTVLLLIAAVAAVLSNEARIEAEKQQEIAASEVLYLMAIQIEVRSAARHERLNYLLNVLRYSDCEPTNLLNDSSVSECAVLKRFKRAQVVFDCFESLMDLPTPDEIVEAWRESREIKINFDKSFECDETTAAEREHLESRISDSLNHLKPPGSVVDRVLDPQAYDRYTGSESVAPESLEELYNELLGILQLERIERDPSILFDRAIRTGAFVAEGQIIERATESVFGPDSRMTLVGVLGVDDEGNSNIGTFVGKRDTEYVETSEQAVAASQDELDSSWPIPWSPRKLEGDSELHRQLTLLLSDRAVVQQFEDVLLSVSVPVGLEVFASAHRLDSRTSLVRVLFSHVSMCGNGGCDLFALSYYLKDARVVPVELPPCVSFGVWQDSATEQNYALCESASYRADTMSSTGVAAFADGGGAAEEWWRPFFIIEMRQMPNEPQLLGEFTLPISLDFYAYDAER